MAKHRYVKANNPAVFTYFTDDSIRRYDPVKGGWIKDIVADHPTPVDVVNFMKPKDVVIEQEIMPQVIQAELTDFSTIPTLKLPDLFKQATEEELLNVIKTDERTTAKKYAEKEIKSRELC